MSPKPPGRNPPSTSELYSSPLACSQGSWVEPLSWNAENVGSDELPLAGKF